ncbi:MAG: DUF2126 domain-containing protein [Vicinamibacterales bacterium]
MYDREVTLSPHVIRLRPAPHSRTPVPGYSLKVEPHSHFINWQQDPQGNFLARLTFPSPTTTLSFEVDLIAEMTVINPFDFFLEPSAEQLPFEYEGTLLEELAPFLVLPPAGDRLKAWLRSVEPSRVGTVSFLVGLNQRLQREIQYVTRLEPGVQSSDETLARASGSCRDTAWLLVQILRHLGLATRFVSGYLIQLKADQKPLDGPAGPAEDFTDLHAWAEVYLPGAGWVGLDPTSGLFAGEGHIPLAATPSPDSAAPVTGMVSPCQVRFAHEMRVTRVHEDPRVTFPYTDAQWSAILSLGDTIDAEFAENDVRLTTGGEPTFVSIDDMDGEEWNTAALGPAKQRLAGTLIRRLRQRFAPGGLLHFGQGKWYPGESLPRWAFTCYWRTDGVPLWTDAGLLDDPNGEGRAGGPDAETFAAGLADRLRVGREHVIAAYEDPLAYVLKERQLPVNVDPIDNDLDDPEERERLRRVFSRGLGKPSGFVLPLARTFGADGPTWQSGLWMLRSRHLFLVPGDSPVGYRLPLQSLLDEPAAIRQQVWAVDPMATRPPLPVPVRHRVAPRAQDAVVADGSASHVVRQQQNLQSLPEAGSAVVRTALTVEARDGSLWIFLPPLASGDDYVELLAAIEDTAAALSQPVMLEGYPPPFDPRLREIKVTPDPGVIEVNVHPSRTWRELVDNTTILYAEARASRLGTEKFMLDGRHTGTGGGNHIVLGGPTPADSPFLRRPDLLSSMIGYWLNHPSLSYLFSGVFIGPTSQSPRVDETRVDAVYELDIAMRQLGTGRSTCPPWLVDRLFRNLLVDVTGNTHRAEFCIDKLYSPDGASGRLGLVELRGFEMPPHPHMSLAQQLLVRALLAMFWKQPYDDALIRWGTRLHDRFLLPYYVEHDFRRVLQDLQGAGYPLAGEWFAPFMEFRFPVYGRVTYDGVEVELRQAIEPWYVLGEEPGTGGTARYVDSSVERLQVKVKGLLPERHVVACNGYRLPLQPTAIVGEFVCGVRYRAWQPPRCLHPTIPVHTPLVVDVVDVRAGRSIGGCMYHVGHPGGRNYETFPVNSHEAEARRRARFFDMGHTPGSSYEPAPTNNPEFPSTLDLRWVRAASPSRGDRRL